MIRYLIILFIWSLIGTFRFTERLISEDDWNFKIKNRIIDIIFEGPVIWILASLMISALILATVSEFLMIILDKFIKFVKGE